MGAQVSTQVANVTTKVVNKSMTNLVSKSTSSSKAVMLNVNEIDIDASRTELINCELNFNQKINAKQTATCMAKFQSLSDMQTQLTSALQSTAAQENEQTQQALSLSLGVSTGISNINTGIENYIETNITNETLNEVNANMINANTLKLKLGKKYNCKGKPLAANQEMIIEQTAALLTDAVIGNKLGTQTDSKGSSDLKTKNKMKQTGIQEVIGALGMAIMLPLVICVVVIAIFVLPGLIKGMGSKGGALKMLKFGKRFRFGRR